MELNRLNIEEYFIGLESTCDRKFFPHGDNYCTKYKSISQELYKWVHSQVDVGSLSAEFTKHPDKMAFLTQHGISHIYTLIDKATLLVDSSSCELSPFELFLLLMAIHFHDIGNMLGRDGHEINAKVFIDKMGTGFAGQDEWIWDYVYDIAKSHKGRVIDNLASTDYLHDIEFRPQLLAAILKFADELAENFSRANKINLDLCNIHDESLLYHKYATCVNTIKPRHSSREIYIIYNLNEDDLKLKFKKGNGVTFLLDEIYLRTIKTYFEKVYCIKFLKPAIDIDSIKVTVKIKRTNGIKEEIGYILEEMPVDETMSEFLRINPHMAKHTGEEWHKRITV